MTDSVKGDRFQRLAFTLTELLVTVGIITLLLGLLLPSLKYARGKGRAAVCISNHKQIAVAWALYADDYAGQLVENPDSDYNQRKQGLGWVVGNLRIEAVAHSKELMANERLSSLAPYVQNVGVYKCPSDESEFVRSVAMNCRMNPTRFDGLPAWVGGLGTNYVTFRKMQDIQRPADVLVVLDEREDSINDAYFAIDRSNTGTPEGIGAVSKYTIIDFPGDYHNRMLMASYADGHVAGHKWRDFVLRTPLGEARPLQVSRPEDKDVLWLQEHSTYPK